MKKLAIFVSGRGTNMDNIITKVKEGSLRAEVTVVFSDKPKALALMKAKRQGINTLHINPHEFPGKKEFEKKVVCELHRRDVDYIILAGYMRILSPYIIKKYRNRILNIHPSLLPAFKGAHAIQDSYQYGVKVTGVTVHFVTDDLDGGPIILQRALDIQEKETLASLEARIHQIEYELYPTAINLLVSRKLTIRKGKVSIKA